MSAAAGICVSRTVFKVADYDLGATLNSGQAFRWVADGDAWAGVLGMRLVRLRAVAGGIQAETAERTDDWEWLAHYLQVDVDLDSILATFPQDEPMRLARQRCRGLRLLRQDPWECLASFILSSTKQIVQIRQIIDLLCQRFGKPVEPLPGRPPTWSFPSAERIAGLAESDLRGCKMGFRAPNLLRTAQRICEHEPSLPALASLSVEEARTELVALPGVGRKIADCVLLFAYGFQRAFPVDVWVLKALRQLYFPKRRLKPARIRKFADTHFGPFAGYAQQYLFHYMRNRDREIVGDDGSRL